MSLNIGNSNVEPYLKYNAKTGEFTIVLDANDVRTIASPTFLADFEGTCLPIRRSCRHWNTHTCLSSPGRRSNRARASTYWAVSTGCCWTSRPRPIDWRGVYKNAGA